MIVSTANNLTVRNLGLVPYDEALQMQHQLVAQREAGAIGDTLLLLEHPHVYTLGRKGSMDNILLSEAELDERGIGVHRVERGGDVTYHGPGQLVAYPILDLAALRGPLDYPRYVRDLERVLLAAVADFGIAATQLAGYSGIWVAQGDKRDKLAAIGVHVNGRGISSHGIALNVNTDLRYFGYIIPCGISDPDKGVTSMAALLAQPLDLPTVAARFTHHLAATFGLDLLTLGQDNLAVR
jgi:lipoyl(octanoyl) transferase